MDTFGFDVLLQVNEKLLNKSLAALFYTGMLQVSGKYAFVEGIPDRLLGFTQVGYKIRLKNEPCLDLVGPPLDIIEPVTGRVGIRLSLELKLRILTGVDVEFDVDFGATARVGFDPVDNSLSYSMVHTSIYDMKINDKLQMHKNMLERTNEIIAILLKHYLANDIKAIRLPIGLSQIAFQLPQTEGASEVRLPIRFAEVLVFGQNLLVIGVNFFADDHGHLAGMTDRTGGSELYAAVDTDAIREIMAFWWANTRLRKIDLEGSLPVDIGTNRTLAKVSDIFTRLVTLGLLQPETEIASARFYYDAEVNLAELPEVSFETGGYAEVKNLKLFLKIAARLETKSHKRLSIDSSLFIPDTITPWNDDILVSDKDVTNDLLKLQDEFQILVKSARCKVTVDEENRITVKIVSADLDLDFGSTWIENLSEKVMNSFIDILEKHIISKIPAFVLSPSLLLKDVKVMGYTFDVDVSEVVLEKTCLSLRTDVAVNELCRNIIPLPLYIGNTHSHKLHRFDCRVATEIDFAHRIGYHLVYDAIHDGFTPCKECLKGYAEMNLQ